MLSKYRTILRIQFLRPGSRDPLHGIPVMHSLTSVHVRTVHVRTVHVRTVHVRTAHVRTAHGRTAHGRTVAQHGRSVHACVAWPTLASLVPRSAHAHAHARPTLTRMLAPRAHARATRARPTPLRCGPTLALGPQTRATQVEDRTAVDATATAATDTAVVGTTVADSMATAVGGDNGDGGRC